MQDGDQPTKLVRVCWLFLFLVLTCGALYWLIWSCYDLMEQIFGHSPIITFDNAPLYMLSTLFFLVPTTIVGFIKVILEKELTSKQDSSWTTACKIGATAIDHNGV